MVSGPRGNRRQDRDGGPRLWGVHGRMPTVPSVTHLLTVVDLRDEPSPAAFVADDPIVPAPAPGPGRFGAGPGGWSPAPPESPAPERHVMSLSALHLAVLDDGRRLTLLDDRGWSEAGQCDVWGTTTVEAIAATARTVVGPDEPFGTCTAQDMEAGHWQHLAAILAQQGVRIGARELSRMPHEVHLSERVRRRLQGR